MDPVRVPTDDDLKKVADTEKAEVDKRDNDFIEQLSTPAGRRVWFEVIDNAETLSEPFVAGMADLTAYNLGRQSIGRYWMAKMMRLAPDMYFRMCRERKSAVTVKNIIKENMED